jgi:hypothetical protein
MRERCRARREAKHERNAAAWAARADEPLDLEAYIEDARELAGTDPGEALVRVLAWLMASGNMVDVAAAKAAAHVLGLERTKSDLEADERRWIAMTPEARATELLADPVHGPLIRAEVLREQATGEAS